MKRVGIDLDDVLMEFTRNLFLFYNQKNGTHFVFEDALQYELEKVWGCSVEEANRTVLEFYESDIHHSASPVVGAVDVITQLKAAAELFVVTARPEEYKSATMRWINVHFPGVFVDVIFTNAYHGNASFRKKSDVCQELAITHFIDDALHNVEDLAQNGINTFLFDKPWNRRELSDKTNVQRIYGWDEVEI